MARVTVQFAGKEYSGESLSGPELDILKHHVYDYLAYGNSFLSDLFRMNEDSIIAAAAVAKEKFQTPFAGLFAGDNQIGIQMIRPGHILRTTGTTETPNNDWAFTFTSAGDYWVGFGTNNTTAVNIDKEALLLPLAVKFGQGSNPIVEELLIQVGETTYPVAVIRHAWDADNVNRIRAARIHPILAEPKQTVLIQSYAAAAGVNDLILVGLTFGYGRFLRRTSYTSVAL